ncbi:restriction modification system DNA specificity domain protein [Nostoc sp. NIES-2111]|nr:restriction modification system DNA specificity domain protein [Nostoc sp. NIES-2111]
MKVDTFFQNFELLTDAPNAVAKLRELILQLAVRGKLVTQKDDDEPASFLLENIETEKKKLIKSKRIKKIETLPINKDITFLFKLPKKWALIRLGNLVEKLGAGSTPLGGKNVYVDDGVKFLRSQNVWNDGLNLEEVAYITSEIHQKMSGTVVEAGDILLNITGASIGRCAVVPDDFDEGNVSQHVSIIRLINKDLRHYLHLCLISSLIQNQIMEVQVGISREGLSMNRLKDFLIPVPPLAEQKRIVEKCDRLLSICDEIEKRQQQRQESIVRMNESAIAQLLSSQNPDDFRQHWQRICNNFDLLYSVPETIPKLRQAILQLAVQGKLVRQEFDDVALRYLIERITEERLALCPNEKDKQRILSEFEKILEESSQGKTEEFEIPAICICDFITKGTTPSNSELLPEGEIPYLKVYNIVNNKIDFFYKPTYISKTVHTTKLKRSVVFTGDVLMNIVGPPLGKVAIVPDDFPEWNINQALAVFRPVDSVYNRFMYYALSCYATLEKVLNETKGTAGQDNLSLEQCRSLRIPLYTIETQKRIVEKCDRLMSLCDTLEAKLKQGRDSSEKLMEVAAKQVLTA